MTMMPSTGMFSAAGLQNLWAGVDKDMMMYMLAGMGGKLGGKGSWQETLGGMTQMGMAAKSQKGLEDERMMSIGKMLRGDPATDIPEGGSVTYKPEGMTLKLPGVGGAGGAADATVAPAPVGGENVISPPSTGDRRTEWRNPLPSPLDVSSANLAGLTTQDVSRALTGATNVETLRQAVLERRAARADVEPLDRTAPVSVPGVGQVTQREWSSMPAENREYAIYHAYSVKNGATPLGPREYALKDPTEKEKFLKAAMEDPDLMAAAKELAKAGATRITLVEKLEEVKAKAGLKGQLYFKDPKWTEDIEKHISSEDVQNELIQYEPGSTEMLDAKAKIKIKFIEDKITAGGGEIVSVKWATNGKTMVWTVKWPSGDTEKVKYAIRS